MSLYSDHLIGEARLVAGNLFRTRSRHPGNQALVAGGETTVTLTGTGKGSRNQEMALASEHETEHRAWAFLSAGTDGIDGRTDAAGAIVDSESTERIRRSGLEPAARLTNNDAYPALMSLGDLIQCGATGTNVADLQILLLEGVME